MVDLALPAIPQLPIQDKSGLMPIEWQDFFLNLFDRVGGFNSSSPSDVEEAMVAGLYDTPKDFGNEILSILQSIQAISPQRNYDRVVDDIGKRFEIQPSAKSYDAEISSLQKDLVSQPSLKSYDQRISALETTLLADAYQAKEPFNYYLPRTVWDDLRFPATSVRGAGVFDPTLTVFQSGIVLAFSTGPNNEVTFFNAQLPHGWKQGSEMVFHLHWTIPVSGGLAGAENVKWDFTYSWANMAAAFPAASTATVTVDVQNVTAGDHLVTDILEPVAGFAGKEISSVLLCSLTRDVGVANDYGQDAYYIEADFHFEIDTIGSREEDNIK